MERKVNGIEEIRYASDYDDFYLASKEETKEQVETAKEIVIIIAEYCNNRS